MIGVAGRQMIRLLSGCRGSDVGDVDLLDTTGATVCQYGRGENEREHPLLTSIWLIAGGMVAYDSISSRCFTPLRHKLDHNHLAIQSIQPISMQVNDQ